VDLLAIRSLVAAGSDAFVHDLRTMVDIDCGSYTPAGVNRIADLCEERFRSGGWTVERTRHVPAEG
jgi:glutamate carboxypeptidase